MPANPTDASVADSTNTESGNPPEEIVPEIDTEAITQNQEPENMEVHNHAHHGGRKNWKSYFWEFVMLFLAVYWGFLAEYQLEHVIEHELEKQYMQSFYMIFQMILPISN